MNDITPVAIPNIIFLDMKTSGLYLRNEPFDSPQQPWAPYIAALQCNDAATVINQFACYIKPDGRMIKGGALAKHGIDHKVASRLGVPEARVLGMLGDMLKVGPFESHMKIVTYGDMDNMVLASLFSRFAVSVNKPSTAYDKLWLRRPLTEFIDLQKPFAQLVCKLPSEVEGGDYRWPTFNEAASIVLDRQLSESPDSFTDLVTIKDMYFAFAKRGFFSEGANT
jgi:hypothetical protein